MTKVHTLTHTHTRDTGAFTGAASAIHKAFYYSHTHGHRVERRRRRQRHARADGFGLGGARRSLLCLPERAVCRLCAQLESGKVQGSVAARANAAVVAAAAAAAARAGGLIRTGRSDRLGGRRRSRRKLSIYVQKPLGRVCCAVCSRKTNGCLGTS